MMGTLILVACAAAFLCIGTSALVRGRTTLNWRPVTGWPARVVGLAAIGMAAVLLYRAFAE